MSKEIERQLKKNLHRAMLVLSNVWSVTDSETLEEGYPFASSFDELTAEVGNWVDVGFEDEPPITIRHLVSLEADGFNYVLEGFWKSKPKDSEMGSGYLINGCEVLDDEHLNRELKALGCPKKFRKILLKFC